MATPPPPPPLPRRSGANSTRASSLPSSFGGGASMTTTTTTTPSSSYTSPYDTPYDYDDTLPALRRTSSIATASSTSTGASSYYYSSSGSPLATRSTVANRRSSSTSSLVSSFVPSSFRRSSTASRVSVSSIASSSTRRSSSMCWVQDGSGDDDDDVRSEPSDDVISNTSSTDGLRLNSSMMSTASFASSTSSSFSSSASTSSSLWASSPPDLDAEETSLSYDDDSGDDVAFLYGAPSASYDVLVKPSSTSSTSTSTSSPIGKWISSHPVLLLAACFVMSFVAGGAVSRKRLLLQLVKVRAQNEALLLRRNEAMVALGGGGGGNYHSVPLPLDKVPTTTATTQELRDQLDQLKAALHAKKFELERVMGERKDREQQILDAFDNLGPIVSSSHDLMMMNANRRSSSGSRAAAAAPSTNAMSIPAYDPDNEGSYEHKEAIANLVKTMAYDQFGSGVHEVEFHVRYYPDEHDSHEGATNTAAAFAPAPAEGTFVVEVADFESNPLSGFLFLQQVEHGLWDDTSFHVNAPHMLLAQPTSANHSDPTSLNGDSTTLAATDASASRLPEMQALGLNRLPIMEYSDHWGRHDKYTLGFGSATATAGSFFFVNKMNNLKTHDGQACFGQVVEGTDVMDKIFALSDYDGNFRLRRPVEIVSVHILDDDHHHQHHDGEDEHEDEEHHHHHEHVHHDHHKYLWKQHRYGSHGRSSRHDHEVDQHHDHPNNASHDHDGATASERK